MYWLLWIAFTQKVSPNAFELQTHWFLKCNYKYYLHMHWNKAVSSSLKYASNSNITVGDKISWPLSWACIVSWYCSKTVINSRNRTTRDLLGIAEFLLNIRHISSASQVSCTNGLSENHICKVSQMIQVIFFRWYSVGSHSAVYRNGVKGNNAY